MTGTRIVLTGGPCAGKTTVAQVLDKAFPNRLVIVPEAASLLFRGGFPRWPEPATAEALQRAVYRVQVELETAHAAHHPDKILIMDRGTVDGAAYWPKGPEDFYKTLNTTATQELARYDLVIYLESAGQDAYDSNRRHNPVRTESWAEASALDAATRSQWQSHANLVMVHNNVSFSSKIASVLTVVEKALEAAASRLKKAGDVVAR